MSRAEAAVLLQWGKLWLAYMWISGNESKRDELIKHINDGLNVPVEILHPFEDNSMGLYQVAVYRFAGSPAHGNVVTRRAPLAIGTLYE